MIGLTLEELLADPFGQRFHLVHSGDSVLTPSGHKTAPFIKLAVAGEELRLALARRLLDHPVNRPWAEEFALAFLERLEVRPPARPLSSEWTAAGAGVQVSCVLGEEWLVLSAAPPQAPKKKGLWGLLGGG